MTRILIADDHDLIREGLRARLEDHPDLEVGGEARTIPELLKLIRAESWDLVIMDLGMPGGEGLETVQRIHASSPDLPIIVLSMHPEDELARRLLRGGVSGYVEKGSAADELMLAVRAVLRGDHHVSRELASELAADLGREKVSALHETLSDREFQLLRLLGEGKSISGIADELTLSVKTVSTYKARLLKKMEMETTAELIRYALEHDLVQ